MSGIVMGQVYETLGICRIVDQNRLDAVKKAPFGQCTNNTSTDAAIAINSESPSQLERLCLADNMIDRKPKMLHHVTTRSRFAEGLHTDDIAVQSDVLVPSIRVTRLDC